MVVISDNHIILDDGTSVEVGKRYFLQHWGARLILIKSIKNYIADDKPYSKNECWITYYEDIFLHKLTDNILTNGRFEKKYNEYGGECEMIDTIKQFRISYDNKDFEAFGIDHSYGLTLLEEIPEQLFIDVVNNNFKTLKDYYTTTPQFLYISDNSKEEDPFKSDDIYIMSKGIRDDNRAYIRNKKLEKLLASI